LRGGGRDEVPTGCCGGPTGISVFLVKPNTGDKREGSNHPHLKEKGKDWAPRIESLWGSVRPKRGGKGGVAKEGWKGMRSMVRRVLVTV